jgi:hypothetical protein
MDKVIFTGTIPEEEYKHDRPREYEELKNSGRLKDVLVKKEGKHQFDRAIRIFGFTMLGIGLSLVVLIIYSMLFGYN